MTRDQIIRMARDAGIRLMGDGFGKPDRTDVWATQEEFERFAALVAAAERQRLHDKFMQTHQSQQHSNNYWHFAARKIKEEA